MKSKNNFSVTVLFIMIACLTMNVAGQNKFNMGGKAAEQGIQGELNICKAPYFADPTAGRTVQRLY